MKVLGDKILRLLDLKIIKVGAPWAKIKAPIIVLALKLVVCGSEELLTSTMWLRISDVISLVK